MRMRLAFAAVVGLAFPAAGQEKTTYHLTDGTVKEVAGRIGTPAVLDYATGCTRAREAGVPLLVWTGRDAPRVSRSDGCVTAHYPGFPGRPEGVWVLSVFEGDSHLGWLIGAEVVTDAGRFRVAVAELRAACRAPGPVYFNFGGCPGGACGR